MCGKYSQKPLDHTSEFFTDSLKAVLRRAFRKKQKKMVIFFVTKLLIELQKSQYTSQQNNSEKLKLSTIKEILKERYVSAEERQKIMDDLILV